MTRITARLPAAVAWRMAVTSVNCASFNGIPSAQEILGQSRNCRYRRNSLRRSSLLSACDHPEAVDPGHSGNRFVRCARADGRIDVPDLFLAGLGLMRKGGVRMNWAAPYLCHFMCVCYSNVR